VSRDWKAESEGCRYSFGVGGREGSGDTQQVKTSAGELGVVGCLETKEDREAGNCVCWSLRLRTGGEAE